MKKLSDYFSFNTELHDVFLIPTDGFHALGSDKPRKKLFNKFLF